MILPSLEAFGAFTIAGLTLLLIPGPAVMYITALGLRQGRTPAVAAAVGLGLGNFMHVLAAVVGLSALLLSSAVAFTAVKYAGAAYLIYLGIQALRSRGETPDAVEISRTTAGREFRRGFVVNTFNPKVAVFFLAFVPQFVNPGRGPVAAQVLVLGIWFVVLGIATDALYGVTAGEVGGWVRGRLELQRTLQRFTGMVYIALGVFSALVPIDRSEAAASR